MFRISKADGVPVKDKVLYWPTVLALFWYWSLMMDHGVQYQEGDLVAGPALVAMGPLLSFLIAFYYCMIWLLMGAWRRILSMMILLISSFWIAHSLLE